MRAFFLLLSLSFSLSAETLKSPVVDDAGIFSPDQEAALERKLDGLKAEKDYWLVVHTVNTLSGVSIEDYAVKKFKLWQIGQKDKDNGLLLVIAMKDRKMRLEVGYGLEGEITDLQAVNLLDTNLKPSMRSGDPFSGVLNLIMALNPKEQATAVSEEPALSTFVRSFFLEGISEEQMNGYRYIHDNLYNQRIHLQISQTKEHFYKEQGFRAIRILVAPNEFSIESEVSILNLMDKKDIEEAYRTKGKAGIYEPIYRIGGRIALEENLRFEKMKAEMEIRENGINRWVYYSYLILFPLYLAGVMMLIHRKMIKEIFADCRKKEKDTVPGKAARIKRALALFLPVFCFTVGFFILKDLLNELPVTDMPIEDLGNKQFSILFFMFFGSAFFFAFTSIGYGIASVVFFCLIVAFRGLTSVKADRELWFKELPDAPSGGGGGGGGRSYSSSSSSSSSSRSSSSSSSSGGGRSGGGGGSSSW